MTAEISENDMPDLFKQAQAGFGAGASSRTVHKKGEPEPDEEETSSPAAQPESLLER